MAWDYIATGVVFSALGLLIVFVVRRDSRPGDILLNALPEGLQDSLWGLQRVVGFAALGSGLLFLLYGLWLSIRG